MKNRSFAQISKIGLASISLGILVCCQQPVPNPLKPAPDYPKDSIAGYFFQKSVQFFPSAPDSIIFYANASTEQAEQKGDWHTWGDAQRYILTAHYLKGAYSEAVAALPTLQQKAAAHIPQDSTFWVDYYNNYGAIYKEMGNYEKALEFGKREIDFYDAAKSKSDFNVATGLAGANNNIGIFYLGRGDFNRAWDYLNEARRLYESFPETYPFDLVLVQANIGKALLRQKEFSKAIFWFQKALNLLKKQPAGYFEADPSLYSYASDLNLEIGNAYIGQMEYDKALDYLLQSLKTEETHQIKHILPYTLHSLSTVYSEKKQFDKAEAYLIRAMKLVDSKDPYYGRLCFVMGILSRKKNQLESSLKWQQKSLWRLAAAEAPANDFLANPTLMGASSYFQVMQTLIEKGKTLRLLADRASNPALQKNALATYQLAITVLDTMRNIYQEDSKQFWNDEVRPVLENAIDLALILHQSTSEEQYLAQAFSYSEKGKAYLLAEALRESAAKQKAGIPMELLEEEKQLKIDIAFYKGKIFEATQNASTDKAKISLWESEIHLRFRQEEALKAKLEASYPEYFQVKYRQSTPSMADIQQALPENTGMLEYFEGDSVTYAFYIDRHHAKAVRCGAVRSLLPLLAEMHGDSLGEVAFSAEFFNKFTTNAADLYQNLVAPVLRNIPAQLIVIPDGQLACFPFEMLLTQKPEPMAKPSYDQLPYLLLKTEIRYEYTGAMAFQKHGIRSSKQFFEGFAPAYGKDDIASIRSEVGQEIKASSLASLSNNKQEVVSAARLTGGRAVTGQRATKSYFVQHAADSRILHLAMHGFVNDSFPAYSGLVFSPQAQKTAEGSSNFILFASDIYNMHLNAELAVLSACETGRGKLARGEGILSLGRAFKYAGCPNVLMSLWQADDKSAAAIMKNFYEHLKDGQGKSAAIHQAKLDYLLHSNRKSHPFYWAAFVLIGDDLPLQQPTNWLWYVGGLLLLAGLVVLFLVRKKPSFLGSAA